MKKIISLITASAIFLFCCSCGDSKDEKEIFEDLRSSHSEIGTESEYYIRVSETAAGANTLKEASKQDGDCAFIESGADGTLKFFRNGKYTVSSIATFYAFSEQDAQWSDFRYDDDAEKYGEIYRELIKNDSFSVEMKSSGDKSAPYKVTAKYDMDSLDTKSLFKNGGDYGYVTISFLTDKKGETFKNITLNFQYDYVDTIYLYSVQFGAPNPPDSDGNGGQRPEDLGKIFEDYKKNMEST